MPQQTNLNVSPYFDDFNQSNDYHRVLFKPGYPVQARELTTLQSILQNQIEQFGTHFFKEGSKVIPGNTGYNQLYNCVLLNNTFQGIPVSAYADQLVGTKITGETSGVSAVVDSVLLPENSERGSLTLYITYLNSSTANNTTQVFQNDETLVSNTTIASGLLGNTSISAGSPFASTRPDNATATGSSFQIQQGIYFIRGFFVNVDRETLVLDQYDNSPSYRVGLLIREDIITPEIDESLNDNSQGFNNYAAPGADRLKISVNLFKKPLDDFDDNNFIELASIDTGVLRTQQLPAASSAGIVYQDNLADTLAKRTFDESGHYVVRPFDIGVLNSLNDNLGNNGVFQEDEFTYGGTPANENLALYKISSGKAYVKGYEVETTTPTFIDVEKPRTERDVDGESISYNTGSTFTLNRVMRGPDVGVGNTYVVSLRDRRGGADQNDRPGNEIGLARLYDFRLKSGRYNNATSVDLNEWGTSLYDVKTYSNITINQAETLSVPTHIRGANSGAQGFLRYAVQAGTAVTVYDYTGSFLKGEQLIFNGIASNRVVVSAVDHSISEVKSLFATDNTTNNTGINTFAADIVPQKKFNVGVANIIGYDSNAQSVVYSTNPRFLGTVLENDLVKFSNPVISGDPTLARVVSVGTTSVTIVGVHTVAGIANGLLPAAPTEVSDMDIMTTKLDSSSDNTLFTKLSKNNIATVDMKETQLVLRKSYTVNITNSGSIDTGTPIEAAGNEIFMTFTPQRYSLIRSTGVIEPLTAEMFDFSNDQKTINNITGMNSGSDTGAQLIATVRKSAPLPKRKIKNRASYIVVDKSKLEGSGIDGVGIGTTTLNNGLTYGNYAFGTRVEDDVISLNTPDVFKIHAIYESSGLSDPIAPRLTFSDITSATSTTSDVINGELVIGQNSGAIAICVEKPSSLQVAFVSQNQVEFAEGETVIFQESLVEAVISSVDDNHFNISSNYTFSTGQQKSIYGYSSIRRRPSSAAPTKRLKIYFAKGSFDANDTGDLTTIQSYEQFDYAKEIQSIDGISNADILDIRPRVSDFSVVENTRSPLEFLGRTFNQAGNSPTNIFASEETSIIDFSYYQGRIDRVFLTKEGKFQVVYGTPADKPEPPTAVADALEIATVTLPPFLYNPEQASLKFLENKRYRMSDIKQLENRIRNLEYYTSLSLLETKTENMFITDSEGLNRFKSGFFVDNFNSFQTQETQTNIRNSIDRRNKELRPKHYTNSIDMVFGPVVGVDPTTDFNYNVIESDNVRKENDILSLEYSDQEWLAQNFATRSETVAPFASSFWQGSMELTPASDTWADTVRVQSRIIETEGNYTATIDYYDRTNELDPQSGFVPLLWDSWESNWTGVLDSIEGDSRQSADKVSEKNTRGTGQVGTGEWARKSAVTVTQEEFQETFDLGTESRGGTRTIVHEEYEKTSVGDRNVSRDLISFMRSRNIQFYGKNLKPSTEFFPYFDGTAVSRFCIPKLLEIEMNTGAFQAGEAVRSVSFKKGVTACKFAARLATIDHKEGPYNTPTKTYVTNPYDGQLMPGDYNSTSSFINIDTYSLCNEYQGEYYGFVEVGTVLVGETSGATATVTNLRHISDDQSDCIGVFYIPQTTTSYYPRFECGQRSFVLTSSETNDAETVTSIAEENFSASGLVNNSESIRVTRINDKKEFGEETVSTSPGTQIVGTHVVGRTSQDNIVGWYNPLAQSFLVDDETGIFLSRIELYFRAKDTNDVPVMVSIRTMENGLPSSKVLPFSEIIVDPEDIDTSLDGSIATVFQMKAPVYLEGRREYAICVSTNSREYSLFVARIGQNDIQDGTLISNQPYLGNLFKSQNVGTWEASQWEDLKFNLYRAEFEEGGTVEVYSPQLAVGNHQITTLMPDSIMMEDRSLRIGVGIGTSAFTDGGFEVGNTFQQMNTLATGVLTGVGASATGDLTITSAGVGYTPVSGRHSFNNVELTTITGKGSGARADVTIDAGVAIAATITTDIGGGIGYQIGDVLGITTIGSGTAGSGVEFTVAGVGATSVLFFNHVQGDFVVSTANTITYINSSGLSTEFNYHGDDFEKKGTGKINAIKVLSDGEHIKVTHQNHGMNYPDNLVQIFNAESDIPPTKLSVAYEIGSTAAISVDDNSAFGTFENAPVSTTNAGYLKIGNEIIEYTEVSGANIIGGTITRGVDKATYPIGTLVYKYELNGVNLARINKVHDLEDVTKPDPIGFDSYHLKLNMAETFSQGTGVNNIDRSNNVTYPALYVKDVKETGGYNIRATQNIPFEVVTPMVQLFNPQGTTINAELRTTTTQSLDGNEVPYVNNGYESVQLNKPNFMTTPRAVFSKVNEDDKLSTSPGNKSMSMRMSLNTIDSRLSPIIDAQRINTILTTNRVDQPITDYATDARVNGIDTDPTAFQYVSREISLENPATSLKIVLNAHINSYNDIRAFYAVGEEPNGSPVFIPFPGYENLNDNGEVIDPKDSNGLPDALIQKSNTLGFESRDLEYREYTFTLDNLPSFKFYRIKLVATSTSQVYVPRVKDLRVIALA